MDLSVLESKETICEKLWVRTRKRHSKLRTPIQNLYAAFLSLCRNGWQFEHFLVFAIALIVTVMLCLIPSNPNDRLASQLNFHVSLLGT